MTTNPTPAWLTIPLKGLTYKVIGLAMDVHNDLSPGHREETCHNAMTQKYVGAGVMAEREPKLPSLDYFAASDCEVLLIFNFGKPRLEGSACFRPSKFWLIGANVGHGQPPE